MEAFCRDLGLMDYKTCWELQQGLFDALVARKAARKGTAEPAAYGGTTQARPGAGQASVPEPAQTTPPATAHAERPGCEKDTESPTDSYHATTTGGVEPRGITGENSGNAGTILLVEHPPVYTLGKSGHAENLLIGREALETMGAQFFHIDRGGDITFHGPGQLVCYPILDLERLGIGLRDYIGALEEAVIRTVAEYGITAGRMAGASGVWIGPGIGGEAPSRDNGDDGNGGCECPGYRNDGRNNGSVISASGMVPRKICAIGVRSSRYITMHGFALNVTTDLGWFARINPCGFTDRGVTSIERETGRKAAMGEVKELVVKFLSEILNVRIYK